MRLFLSLILIAATFGCANASIADFFNKAPQTDTLYVKASLYEQDGNYEEAAKLLENVLDSVNDEYIYLKLARVYAKLKDREMVKFTLERGLRKIPESPTLLGALADLYRSSSATVEQSYPLYQRAYKISGNPTYAEGEAIARAASKDYNGAIKIYDGLIQKDPKSDYLVQRARFYEKLGLEKEAMSDYQKAADKDENFIAAAKLADYFVSQGDNAKAIKYLHMVIKASPDLTLAKFRLAELLRKMGKNDEAAEYYTQTISFLNDSEKEYVLKQLGAIYYQDKNYDKSLEYFKKAYDMSDDIQTAYSMAVITEASGDIEGARRWYEKILDKRPDFVEASKRLAVIYLKEKRPEKALDTLNSIDKMYQDVNYYRIKGQAYTDMGKSGSAVNVLTEALKNNPAEVKLYLDLALAQDKNNDKKAAEATVKEGLKLFPKNPSLLNFLGYSYAERGVKLDEAKKLIQKALDKKPDEPAYLDSMAWVLYRQGMYKEALPFQERALKGAPKEQEIRDHMKAILKKLGIRKSLDDIIKEK